MKKNTMKTLLGLISGLLITVLSGSAYAATNAYSNAYSGDWYLGISGDVTWPRHSDTGGGGNIDLGYFFAPGLSIEGEAGYHSAPGKNGYTNTHYFTYMGNVYYDINQLAYATPNAGGWRVAPYIGGGIGAATVHFGDSSFANTFHHHDTYFAYEGMAGLSFICNSAPNAEWNLGYRYTGTTGNYNISANNIELGLKVHF